MIGLADSLMGPQGLLFGLSSGIYGFFEGEHATALSLPRCELVGGAGRAKNSRDTTEYINSSSRWSEKKRKKGRCDTVPLFNSFILISLGLAEPFQLSD